MRNLVNRRDLLRAGVGVAVGMSAFGSALGASARRRVSATSLGERVLLVSGVGGNVVALRGDEGLLLVDSGAIGSTSQLQSELNRFARGMKVHTVLNTHWHADQTGGNDVFGKDGARLIAHAKAAQRMRVDQFVPWEDRYIKARAKVAVPTEVFYFGRKEMRFGDESIEYGYLQQPHTDGDIYVHFRNANVLMVGDAAAPVGDPELAWFEGGWPGGRADSLAQLLEVGNAETRIVASTGDVISRAELQVEHDAMVQMFDRVSDAMRKGMTTEDMQKARLLDGLPRKWADPDKALYDAHKGMWAHYNKLSHTIV